jgi:hypothetical protein
LLAIVIDACLATAKLSTIKETTTFNVGKSCPRLYLGYAEKDGEVKPLKWITGSSTAIHI